MNFNLKGILICVSTAILIILAMFISAVTVFGQSSRGTLGENSLSPSSAQTIPRSSSLGVGNPRGFTLSLLGGGSSAFNQTGSLDDRKISLRVLFDSEFRRDRWGIDNRFSVLFGPRVNRENITKTIFTNATVARVGGSTWFGGPGVMVGTVRTSRNVQERTSTEILGEFGRRFERWDSVVYGTLRLKSFGKDSHNERGGTLTFEVSKLLTSHCGISVRLIPGYLRFTNQSETVRRWQGSFDALVGGFCRKETK